MHSRTGKAQVDQELADAMLARRMRWTWQQLRSQPKRFIDILVLMERIDADKQREETAEAERKARMARAKAKHK